MELRVRRLQEKDWDTVCKWWDDWNSPRWPKDLLPGAWQPGDEKDPKREGLGGFMVCKDNDPIAAMWLFLTNGGVAFPAVCVSDRYYKDNDRSDALQLLTDFTTEFAEDMGYKYAFTWAKEGKMIDYYKNAGFYQDETPSYELIKTYGSDS